MLNGGGADSEKEEEDCAERDAEDEESSSLAESFVDIVTRGSASMMMYEGVLMLFVSGLNGMVIDRVLVTPPHDRDRRRSCRYPLPLSSPLL